MAGGMAGGSILNNTSGWMDGTEEEDSDNDSPYARTLDNTPLHNPSPTLPNVDDLQGRRFPPRQRALNEREITACAAAMSYLDHPTIQRLYGPAGIKAMHSVVDSDFYPLELVGYAMAKTKRRDEMYPEGLGNPTAYTLRLLNDWKAQGFKTPEDVQESKDDWMHFG